MSTIALRGVSSQQVYPPNVGARSRSATLRRYTSLEIKSQKTCESVPGVCEDPVADTNAYSGGWVMDSVMVEVWLLHVLWRSNKKPIKQSDG